MTGHKRNADFVLLVDDDLDDQLLFRQTFNELNTGLDLFTLPDGYQALEYLQITRTLPSLIIVDYNMPIITGAELIKSIKKLPKLTNIPIVLLSTSILQKEECLNYGAIDCFVKPDSIQKLTATIISILKYRVIHDFKVMSAE